VVFAGLNGLNIYSAPLSVSKRHCSDINTFRTARFQGFSPKKAPKRTWLCAGISPLRYALQTQ